MFFEVVKPRITVLSQSACSVRDGAVTCLRLRVRAATTSRQTGTPVISRALRQMVNRSPGGDQRLAMDTGFELGDEPVEVSGRPRVQIGQAYRFPLLWI